MTAAPTLSVVVAVHGVAAQLPACLDSLLAGPEPGVEVVAVDDASPDGAGSILDAYAAGDPRLRVLHLPRNVGLGPARNAGLDEAAGAYVWFVDGDDAVAPGAVARVLVRLATLRPDVLLLGHARLCAPGGLSPGPRIGESAPGPLCTLRERPALIRVRQAAWNRVVSRDLLAATGVRFGPGWYEDVPFSHLVLAAAHRIAILDEVCYHYRERGQGAITATRSARHFEVFAQYERLFATLGQWRAAPRLRARLFGRMVEHYLVIAGAPDRLPPPLRRAFFDRMVAHYRRYRPVGGYPVPTGIAGLRHDLVRLGAYRTFAAAGWVRRLRRFPAPRRLRAGRRHTSTSS